jgi:hypothetical protein
MKNIVVYILTVVAVFLMATTGLQGQKPAIDLISSHQQYRHPEAIIDTGNHAISVAMVQDSLIIPSSRNENLKLETEKKRSRQIGPSFESIFHKETNKGNATKTTEWKISRLKRQYQFLKILIYITALN